MAQGLGLRVAVEVSMDTNVRDLTRLLARGVDEAGTTWQHRADLYERGVVDAEGKLRVTLVSDTHELAQRQSQVAAA
jgi:hypothetical protein